MDGKNRVIENGCIGVLDGIIMKVGECSEFENASAEKVLDASDKIVMPGLIDTHGHAGHGLTKTMGAFLDVPGWLRLMEYIYYENTTPDFWYAEGLLSALERIKFGTTTGFSMLGSAPRFDDIIYADSHAQAVQEVGIRDVIGIGPCRPPWPRRFARWNNGVQEHYNVSQEQALNTTKSVLKKWHGKNDQIFAHVSPSEIGSIMGESIEEIRELFIKLKRIADEFGTKLNSHLYSGGAKFAKEYLDGVLSPDTIIAHATGISDEEIQIIAESGAHVSSSPSARAFSLRRCPVPELLDAGVNVCLSSDGTAPDRTFDLFKELKVAMIVHRAYFGENNYLPPGKTLRMVTIDAAKALGLDSYIGSLEENKKADIILVNFNSPHMLPKFMAPLRIAYEATGHDVDTVIIDGKIIMKDRKPLSVDESKVLDMAQKEAEKMLERADIADTLKVPDGFWDATRFSWQPFDKCQEIAAPDFR
mgnify:CR=1 FL=1